MKKLLCAMLAGSIILGAVWIAWQQEKRQSIVSFEDCALAGGSIMESYPRQCVWAGKTFVEQVAVPPSESELVQFPSGLQNSLVKSPLVINGQAVGNWFFEASFPIKVIDAGGAVLGTGVAQAQGEWMTTSLVPFTAEIKFSPGNSSNGYIVFEKDNPSGLPQNDASIKVPVKFK